MIAETLDIPETLSESLNTKALIVANAGRWNEAEALLQHALAIALQRDKPTAALRAYNNLVDFVAADRFADGDELVGEGLAFARRVGEALRLAEIAIGHREALSMGHFAVKESFALGLEAALRLDDREKLGEIIAMLQAEPVGRRRVSYQAHVARTMAGLRLFAEAIAAFRGIGMRFRLAVTLLEYGEWLAERSRATDAEPAVAEARALFDGLGARPWIDRSDAAASVAASRG